MQARRVVFVTPERHSDTIAQVADSLADHQATPDQIPSVSIDMSPAFIKDVGEHVPKARVKFDKFHIAAHASAALDTMRRLEQKTDPDLKGLRLALLKNRDTLRTEQRNDLDALAARVTSKRTVRALLYREQLRDILDRQKIHVVSAMLRQWGANVMRSKVERMKDVARMIRNCFDGIVAWTQPRQTNGFIEAINGWFTAAKRKARGGVRFDTMRTALFLIAGKLDFGNITRMPRNPIGIP